MKQNFEYMEEEDSLYIYGKNAENEGVAGSIVVDNLILDISNEGNFVGLEIDNVSKVFNIPMNRLTEIESAQLNSYVSGNVIVLAFSIKLEGKEYNFSYMVPKNKISLSA